MFKKQFQTLEDNIQSVRADLSNIEPVQVDYDEIQDKVEKSVKTIINDCYRNIDDKIELLRVDLTNKMIDTENKITNVPIADEVSKATKIMLDKFDSLERTILEKSTAIDELEQKFIELNNRVDARLNDFYKEFTDRYFETMSAFLRWNKEISLVSYISKGKDIDLTKLKQELTRPMVEEGWAQKRAREAEKINKALDSKGDKVRKAWERYREEKLRLEREEKSTELVDSKLDILNILMEGVDVSNIDKPDSSGGSDSRETS